MAMTHICSLPGSLGQVIPQDLKCDLNFSVSVTNTSNIVEFVGLTASERVMQVATLQVACSHAHAQP